jgi:lactoylglutathione lyase
MNIAIEECTGAVDHVGLTVGKLQQTVAFFTEQLGWKVVGERPDYPAIFVSNGAALLTLWQARDLSTARNFDRHSNIGLHHLAIQVQSFEHLDALYEKLKSLADIEIEFAPELSGKGPHKHMIIREPSGLRIEFVHRPPR